MLEDVARRRGLCWGDGWGDRLGLAKLLLMFSPIAAIWLLTTDKSTEAGLTSEAGAPLPLTSAVTTVMAPELAPWALARTVAASSFCSAIGSPSMLALAV
jgi:hypothetical protein